VIPRVCLGLALAAVLVGCGGGKPADPGPPRDLRLDGANTAGRQAMTMGLPEVAIRQFGVALARAYERDDAGAISDAAFNLALAQMRAGDPRTALATVRSAESELARRRAPVPAELALAEAAAAYRAGDPASALAAAQRALDRPASDPDTGPRAWFIRGLIAADRGDRAALAQAVAALPPSKSADLEADRLELRARAALLDDRPGDALSTLDQAAANRQQALDYRGMARALALAGDASLRLGRTADAASYFLRAGRSALLQGDAAMANPLLGRAAELGRQTGQTAIVDEVTRLRRQAASTGG
jgi:tetratricopeptide (TPR) repeat protein